MKIRVVLHEEPDGGYSVEVPALPGCFTEGDTADEALANAREAIEAYLEAGGDLAARVQPKKAGETVRVVELAL